MNFWAAQPLILSKTGSVLSGYPLAWALICPSHWLANPTSSVPVLPQCTFQDAQIVGGMFCDWIGVSVPLLEVLWGGRRWLVQATRSQG